MHGVDWPEGGGRARAASDALREAAGWQGELRERIEGLSWGRITGVGRPGHRLSGAGRPQQRRRG